MIDDLTREFVIETREMLEGASASLIAWEENPGDRAIVDAVFRFVHTVKGSCGFVDQPRIGALAHAAEDVLGQARDGKRTPDRALVGAMLAIVDRIARLVETIEGGGEIPDPASDAGLIAALDKPQATAAAQPTAPAAAASTIRLPVSLLETIMAQVSDLVLARNDLARRLRAHDGEGELTSTLAPITHVVGELRDSVGRARLQPIERLFRGLPRLVRDTAAALGKDVALTIEGDDVEIDREMIEALKDPLTHIVRNAVDHGMEADRSAAGKSARGSLRVLARQSGNQVTIAIEDDGRGIDTARLIEKATAAGIVAPGQTVGPDAATQLIFEPGLSTAAEVTDISGRGVGMDVVRANIERIGGTVAIDNRPGKGLTVTIRVPLTLSILTCLIVEAGGQRFAIPRAAIDEVVAIGSDNVRYEAIGDSHIASVRGALLSVAPLVELLGLPETEPQRLVIVETAGARFALPVSAALEHQELVVRPLAPAIASNLFAGQGLSDDGQPLLLLDALGVAGAANIARTERRAAEEAAKLTVRSSALTFISLDGTMRAVRAASVARIEDVPRSAFVQAGQQTFVTICGTLYPAMLDAPLPDNGMVVTLRIDAGEGEIAWPVARVRDLVPITAVTAVSAKGFEGLILIDGQPVPLLHPVAQPATKKRAA